MAVCGPGVVGAEGPGLIGMENLDAPPSSLKPLAPASSLTLAAMVVVDSGASSLEAEAQNRLTLGHP